METAKLLVAVPIIICECTLNANVPTARDVSLLALEIVLCIVLIALHAQSTARLDNEMSPGDARDLALHRLGVLGGC